MPPTDKDPDLPSLGYGFATEDQHSIRDGIARISMGIPVDDDEARAINRLLDGRYMDFSQRESAKKLEEILQERLKTGKAERSR